MCTCYSSPLIVSPLSGIIKIKHTIAICSVLTRVHICASVYIHLVATTQIIKLSLVTATARAYIVISDQTHHTISKYSFVISPFMYTISR